MSATARTTSRTRWAALALALGAAIAGGAPVLAEASTPDTGGFENSGYEVALIGTGSTKARFRVLQVSCEADATFTSARYAFQFLAGPGAIGAEVHSFCSDPFYLIGLHGPNGQMLVDKPVGPADMIEVTIKTGIGTTVKIKNLTEGWVVKDSSPATTTVDEYFVGGSAFWINVRDTLRFRSNIVNGDPIGHADPQPVPPGDPCAQLGGIENGRNFEISISCG